MPILNFTEIPEAGGGMQRDQFEMFAREFLVLCGFKIIVGPDRGADGGRDLVVEEVRTGVAGETRVKWLVSCKHKAHSGTAVAPGDEKDIHDRVKTHGCTGFIAFYSTLSSSGLATKLNAPGLPFEVQVFDAESIERRLLSSEGGFALAERFFPLSWATWKREQPTRAKIFANEPELYCEHCGKSLLNPVPSGIVVIWERMTSQSGDGSQHIEHVYWCCKKHCDRVLQSRYRQQGLVDAWEDIPDLIIPLLYIRWIIGTLNQMHEGTTYSSEAFVKSREFILNLYPLVSRDMRAEERKRVQDLSTIPSFLGGLGH